MSPNPPGDNTPKRIYLAGPMQGIPEFNFPRFNAVAAMLRLTGHTVFNPAEKDIERLGHDLSKGNNSGSLAEANKQGFSLRQALAEDTNFICLEANAIVMLPGWEKSNGAQAEHRLAVALQSEGMEIVYLPEAMAHHMQMAHTILTESDKIAEKETQDGL
jgi:Domain of unknown function (DUF4406)